MKIQRVLETCLCAEDLESAEAFYTRVLGLQVFSREPGRHVFFKLDRAMFLIFNPKTTCVSDHGVPPHGTEGAGHVAFVMEHDDVVRWRARLERCGVVIERDWTWSTGGRSLYFRDPAGNCLELATSDVWERDA